MAIARSASTAVGILMGSTGLAEEPRVGQPGKDVMWVATHARLVERMLDLAKLTDKDFLIDLGSGDGVIVIAAARRGARALGIEYNAGLVDLARRRAAEAGAGGRAVFEQADLFKSDFSAATVVTMYLTEDLNMRLRPRLLALKPGTRILSQPFRLGDWVPDDSVTITSFRTLLAPFIGSKDNCFFRCTAYLWIVPAQVAGRWHSEQGTLALRQLFQVVSGTAEHGGQALPITEGRLRGSEVRFKAGATAYAGTVAGRLITGTSSAGGVSKPWSARRIDQVAE